MTLPRERAPFSAIVDRPPLRLPGGARIVVWPIVNLEVWDIGKPMARQVIPAPTGQVLLPDVPNWSWHEYGMRVGVWRFFELFERLNVRPTLSINARVCEDYERVAAQARDAGWEFMGHAYQQGPVHLMEDQRAVIHRSMDVLEKFTGKRPVGWLGPGLTQTLDTPELLAEAGVQYIGDWVWDDEPQQIETARGSLVTLPYTVELNDIPTMMVQHHESAYWATRCKDQFDRLYLEGEKRAKIMAVAIHPYISGQPHRIKYLEEVFDYCRAQEDVLFMNGEEILDWYRGDTTMRTAFVLNGPNLNLLGQRQPELYGSETLADVEASCRQTAEALGFELRFHQSNREHELIDWIHEARTAACGIVINPAAFTHTSVALLDALKTCEFPVLEVHISNVHQREAFRHHSYVSLVATGVIAGFGTQGYVFALQRLARLIGRPE